MNILFDITPEEFNQIRRFDAKIDADEQEFCETQDNCDEPAQKDFHLGSNDNYVLSFTGDIKTFRALEELICFVNQNCVDFAAGAVLDKLAQLSKLVQAYANALPKEVIRQ